MDKSVALGFQRRYAESLKKKYPFSQIIQDAIAPVLNLFMNGKRPTDQQIRVIVGKIKSQIVDPYFAKRHEIVKGEHRINFYQFSMNEIEGERLYTVDANQLHIHRRRLAVSYRTFPIYFNDHAIFRIFNREFYDENDNVSVESHEYEPAIFMASVMACLNYKLEVLPIALPFKKGLFLGTISNSPEEIAGVTLNVGNRVQHVSVSDAIYELATKKTTDDIGVLPVLCMPSITIKTYIDSDLLSEKQEQLYTVLHTLYHNYRSEFVDLVNSILFFTCYDDVDRKFSAAATLIRELLNSDIWKQTVFLDKYST